MNIYSFGDFYEDLYMGVIVSDTEKRGLEDPEVDQLKPPLLLVPLILLLVRR